jgi:hypothetical protein
MPSVGGWWGGRVVWPCIGFYPMHSSEVEFDGPLVEGLLASIHRARHSNALSFLEGCPLSGHPAGIGRV